MKANAPSTFLVAIASSCALILALGFAQYAHARAIRVPIIDACDINLVFCGSGGQSDVPGFDSGFVVFNPARGNSAVVILQVKGSVPEEMHSVYLCPGAISNTAGFTGCRRIGEFTTDGQGHGKFQARFPEGSPTETVVALNVANFATILANCPDEPNASCAPAPLQ